MEMNRNLRQLVDNCFEEAQFDAAISTLDLLRSTNHAPSSIHILHLLFISLHPTTHSINLDNPDEQPLNHAALLQQSPRKIVKQSKSPQVLLPPSAVLAASRVLHAFLRTNGPSAFFNALPFYPDSKSKSTSASGVATPNLEFVDSPISTNVLAIHSARNVWEVVKSGFTTRAARAVPPPALVKSRTRQKLGRDASFTESSLSAIDQEDLKPVGENSWLALDWFVALFEADAHASSSPKHSILLLKQLPPPPLGSQTRWDASEPLKVVFYALGQEDPRKQHIGLRLLLLLIDLTRTIYLNHPAFASAVLAQLSSFSLPSSSSTLSSSSLSSGSTTSGSPNAPHTPPPKKRRKTSSNTHHIQSDHEQAQAQAQAQALSHLLALLPSDTPARVAFRMTLCRKLLVGLSNDDGDGDGDDGMDRSVKAGGSWSVDLDGDMNGVNGVGNDNQNTNANANGVGGKVKGGVVNVNGSNGGSAAANTNGVVNTNGMTMAMANGNGIAKPRPRPKPILKKRKKPEDEEGAVQQAEGQEQREKETINLQLVDTPSSSKPESTAVSTPASTSKSTSTSEDPPTTTSTPPPPPPPPAPIQRVPTPSLGELARVLRLGLGLGLGLGSDQSEKGDMLLKVKFELAMAWVGVLRSGGGAGSGSGSGSGKEKGKEGEEPKTLLDERGVKEELGRVLDDVFGRVVGVDVGEEGEGEGESEGMFYRRVLRAFAGV